MSLSAVTKAASPSASPAPWESLYRLPSTVRPEHYDLRLYPDLVTKLFSGSATIQFNSTEEQPYFAIHNKGLDITPQPELSMQEGDEWTPVELDSTALSPSNELYVLVAATTFPAGIYRFVCSFSGSLAKNGLVGFYDSVYSTSEGDQIALATTKFEPTYARMAFPAFDEPCFKATYSVSVVRPSDNGYIVLGNMPVQKEEEETPSAGLTTVTFNTSLPMVTYLVCFVVCDFKYIETILPKGLPFRVYAPEDRVERTRYALDSGVSILQYYETMFGLEFPLPKNDMAAIPDYVSGATEHWGIITYRETSVLYDPLTSSEANKQRVCSVVAHELAHQWFGNLVTLEWWDDLWLNEGFASYIEGKGVAHVQPKWDMEIQFLTESLHNALNIDAQLSSHPIVQQVENPDQITAMFDSISYDKGASVLRMLDGFLTTEVFEAGVNAFLEKYKLANAVTADLWAEMTKQWNKDTYMGDVATIMGTWTEQMGYPVLTTSLQGDKLSLSQARFLQDPTAVSDPSLSPHGYKWVVPIRVLTSDSSTTSGWLNDTSDTIKLPTGASWYKMNPDQVSYYRVNYDAENWTKLTKAVRDKVLLPADRANLLDDSLALADAELLDIDTAMDLAGTLTTEEHLVPWLVGADRLPRMMYLLQHTEVYGYMQTFLRTLTQSTYERLGWNDGGDHLQSMLRPNVAYLACISGLDSCLDESAKLLTAFVVDNASVPLGTTRQVFRQGMVRGGTDEVWEQLWQLSVTTLDATQRTNLQYGLANSQKVLTLTKYIQLSKDVNNVRSQDFVNVLKYISDNPVGTNLVWDWTRLNWPWLVERYTINDRYLGQLIPYITKYFASQERLDEMNAFFTKYPEAGAGAQYRQQALETVQTNIRWRKVLGPRIYLYLKDL